jgi:hypothetical protein
MTDLNPNRVTTGKAGAGRYDFKRNTEAEIDLVDEDSQVVLPLSRQYGPDTDIRLRAAALNDEILEDFKKNPTVDNHLELLRANADIISEVVKARKKAFGGSSRIDQDYPIPGYKNILDHMDAEYKNGKGMPEEVGGVRVRRIEGDSDRTFDIMPDKEPALGKSVGALSLLHKATETLSSKRDYTLQQYLRDHMLKAERKGYAADVTFRNDADGNLQINYLVIDSIQSRRSDFVENHGGSKPISDGWL